MQVNLPQDDAVAVSNPPLGMLEELRVRTRQMWEDTARATAAGAAAAAAAAASSAGGGIHGHHPSHCQRPHVPGTGRFNGRGVPMAFFRPPGF